MMEEASSFQSQLRSSPPICRFLCSYISWLFYLMIVYITSGRSAYRHRGRKKLRKKEGRKERKERKEIKFRRTLRRQSYEVEHLFAKIRAFDAHQFHLFNTLSMFLIVCQLLLWYRPSDPSSMCIIASTRIAHIASMLLSATDCITFAKIGQNRSRSMGMEVFTESSFSQDLIPPSPVNPSTIQYISKSTAGAKNMSSYGLTKTVV